MKKILFVMLSALFAVNVAAQSDFDRNGTLSNGITWSYTFGNMTLTISGQGNITNFGWNEAPWLTEVLFEEVETKKNPITGKVTETITYYYLRDYVNHLVISQGINSIGTNSFANMINIESATLSSSITSIGDNAFLGCTNLKLNWNNINENINISGTAFSGCNNIVKDNSLYINGILVKVFPSYNKSSLDIATGTTKILANAVANITTISNITIPESVTTIGNNAFEGTKISKITIPSEVTSIGTDVFKGTNLKTVTFNAKVSTFSNWFEDMSSLTSINIPSSVTKISNDAFNGCSSLSNITFENIYKIATFGSNIFKGCTSLPVVDGYRMAGDNIIVEVTNKSEKRYVISDDIVYIADGAFNGCDKAQFIDMYDRATAPKLGAGALAEIKNATTFVQSGHENNFPTNIWGTVNKTTIDLKSDKYTSCTFLHDAKIPAGIAVYKATVNGSSVSLTKLNPDNAECYIPARTGVLLRATKEKAGLNFFETASDNNTMDFYTDLTAVYEEDIKFTGNENAYILKTADGVQSFYKATNKNTATIGKCYLDGTKLLSAAKLSMFEEEDITGIEETVSESKTMDTQVFNMAGQKLSAPQKGLNIINGKKYIVK